MKDSIKAFKEIFQLVTQTSGNLSTSLEKRKRVKDSQYCNTKEVTQSNHQESVMLIATQKFWELSTFTLTDSFWIIFGVMHINYHFDFGKHILHGQGLGDKVSAEINCPTIIFHPWCILALFMFFYCNIRKIISEWKSKRVVDPNF